MNILADLASGLRGAAGVLSGDVQKQIMREDEARAENLERRKHFAAQQLIRAAEAGIVPPETAQAGLARLGYGGLPAGPSIDTQSRQQSMRNEQGFRQAVSELGPQASQDQLAQVAAKYGDPRTVLETQQRSLDRRSESERRAAELAANRAARLQEAQERFNNQLTIAREGNATRQQIAELANSTRSEIARINAEWRNGLLELRRDAAGSRNQPKPGEYSLPDGSRINHEQITRQYRLDNKLIDDLDLQILTKTDPQRAAVERERIAKALPFDEYAKQRFGVDVYGGANRKLPPENGPKQVVTEQRKQLKGKWYVKRDGQWYEE